jgi:GntR family transcriptional regulator
LSFYEQGRDAYAALAEHLRGQIISGQWQPGERVPAVATLVRQYEVSSEVAEMALAQLKREGWTEAHRGRGTRVRRRPDVVVRDMTRPDPAVEGIKARLAAQGSPVDEGGVVESVRTKLPTPEEALQLGVPSGLPVLVVRREFWSDGVLVEWDERLLPGEATELRYRLPDQ